MYDNLVHVFQMQEVGSTHRGSQRPFSVLDRLLLTHPVWLQLSLNKDSALYILLREPVGVRTSQLFQSYDLLDLKDTNTLVNSGYAKMVGFFVTPNIILLRPLIKKL